MIDPFYQVDDLHRDLLAFEIEDLFIPSKSQLEYWTQKERHDALAFCLKTNRDFGDRPDILKLSLEDRMKRYEVTSKTHLDPNKPIVIRVDGKSFGSYTKSFTRPFDSLITEAMDTATRYLCSNIPCLIGYTQSDEITIILNSYSKESATPWFNGNVQKIASVAASIATAGFNSYPDLVRNEHSSPAFFDARVWNVPDEDEVTNCLIWRQKDALRNSVQMVARHQFSHSQVHKKSVEEMKVMLLDTSTPWESFSMRNRGGSVCILTQNKTWQMLEDTPLFHEDRTFITSYLESPKTLDM